MSRAAEITGYVVWGAVAVGALVASVAYGWAWLLDHRWRTEPGYRAVLIRAWPAPRVMWSIGRGHGWIFGWSSMTAHDRWVWRWSS